MGGELLMIAIGLEEKIALMCDHVGLSWDDAQDIQQLTRIVASRLDAAGLTPDNPRHYIMQVASRTASGYLRDTSSERRHKRTISHELRSSVGGRGAPSSQLREVLVAVDGLSTILRDSVYLVRVIGLKEREAALVSGCSVDALHARLKRANEKLRLILETAVSTSGAGARPAPPARDTAVRRLIARIDSLAVRARRLGIVVGDVAGGLRAMFGLA
jgi:DNA-directed RNA polymerase specialized sigma24 family protein